MEAYLVGIDLQARPVPGAAPQAVGAPAVASATLLAGLVAWALLAILERVTPSGRTVWVAVAVVALLASLAAPLGGAITGTAANRQPALAMYSRSGSEPKWEAHAIQLLSFRGDAVGTLATFRDPRLFTRFGLPDVLDR